MTWVHGLSPRDAKGAARVALGFCAAATAVSFVSPFEGAAWLRVLVVGLPLLLLLISALIVWIPARWPRPTTTVLAAACLGAVWLMDVLTRDAGFGGQVVLMYPVLFAASQLHRTAAWLLALTGIAADALLVLWFVPGNQAGTAVGYFTVTVVTVTALLVTAGDRQEALVGALRVQADVDHLTGLANRRNLDQTAERALTGPGEGTALILMDLDHFKAINDRHGHPVGDAVLQSVASSISGLCRKGDVACRIGGDELALLLPDCTAEVAAQRAQEIVERVRRDQLRLPDGRAVATSVSVGYVHAPRSTAGDLRQLYAAADDALYLAKRRGRDQAAAASG